ncbi:HYR domain-containing protein, partial [Vitellibacter sp. q18]|nr:HYR domain-containing protein [Aequorivita lutea]
MKKITFLILWALMMSTISWQANAQYCASAGGNTSFENIRNVSYGGIDNTTTVHTGYNDFTAQVANVSVGGTAQLSVTINADGSDYLYAFIDWNQNGVLNDAGEVYTLATSTSSDGPHFMNVTVPAGAVAGNTRMRVKLQWLGSSADPCGSFSYGEVEDYTVNVTIPTGNPPTIACPADITINNVAGTCGAVANFAGVAFDDEDGNISSSIIANPPSGSTFPVGVNTVELSVTDSDGNTATCSFTVTVLDNEAPVAVCQDLTLDLDPVTGTVSITGADIDNGSTDNCGIASMTVDVGTFDCSMTGANTVTLTVTDNSGNSSTCTSTVTIQDVTAPEVFCVGGFGVFTESEDFEGSSIPSGWTTVIESGSQDWTFGSGDMPTGGDFPTNAAIFDDDAAGSGPANSARLISPAYDLTGASNVQLSFDYALQDFIGSGTFEAEVWDGAAWQQVLFVDDQDVNPTNTGDIDVSAYANPAFQVRFTYDDEDGGWNWGAGVDNFLLSYEASSGGGLDVYLDANGMATISPNDLVTGVNEACGYTITAGGAGGGTMGSITTLFATNNGGSPNWTVMYDLTVGPNDIEITDLDVNTDASGAFNLSLYTLVGTYVGNETNASAWGSPVATGSGTGAGTDMPSNAVLGNTVTLTANTTYGIAIIMDVDVNYTNGTGCPGNQCYSNSDLSLSLGTSVAGIFTGSVFANRVWNGTINYTVASSGSGLEFTCADLGENLVEVTVTDNSGNSATCMAVVNVIDNISPVITCGPPTTTVSETEDFEGSSLPAGWATQINAGSQDWTFGSGAMPTGNDFPSNAAIFDDDAAGSGQVNNATLLSPVYDISAAASATLSFDYAMQEFAGDGTLTVEVYDGAAWQQILFVDVDTNPMNTGALDMLPYQNAAFQVRFTYDDEGSWAWGAGIDNFDLSYSVVPTSNVVEIELGPDGTADVDPYSLLSNIDEACGISTIAVDVPTVSCADIGGTFMVTVFVSDASGNIASC